MHPQPSQRLSRLGLGAFARDVLSLILQWPQIGLGDIRASLALTTAAERERLTKCLASLSGRGYIANTGSRRGSAYTVPEAARATAIMALAAQTEPRLQDGQTPWGRRITDPAEVQQLRQQLAEQAQLGLSAAAAAAALAPAALVPVPEHQVETTGLASHASRLASASTAFAQAAGHRAGPVIRAGALDALQLARRTACGRAFGGQPCAAHSVHQVADRLGATAVR